MYISEEIDLLMFTVVVRIVILCADSWHLITAI